MPMKNENSESCAETFVKGWVSIFGPPLKLLSYRGDAFLQALMVAAYNSSLHAATGVSPFFAMLGVEPLDFARNIAAASMAEDEANGLILGDHMTRICEMVLQSSRRASAAAKRWHDRRAGD